MKVLKTIKALFILRRVLAIILILVFCYFAAMFTFLPIEEHLEKKAWVEMEQLFEDYIQAHKNEDLYEIASFHFPKGSVGYHNLIEANLDYLDSNRCLVLKNSIRFEVMHMWARQKRYEADINVFYINDKGEVNATVWIDYKSIDKKWYIKSININLPDEKVEIEQPPLRVDDDIMSYYVNSDDNIDHQTFSNCERLLEITFSAEYEDEININWFYNCKNLISIKVEQENTIYSSQDGVLYSKDKKELLYYPSGKIQVENSAYGEFVIPNTVETIKTYAFGNTKGLKKVVFSSSLKSIENMAFSDSINLEEIVLNDGLITIETKAFYNCEKLQSVTLPDSVKSIGYECFYNCKKMAQFNISKNSKLNSIGYGAFEKCQALTNIYLPDSLVSIDNWTFQNCYNIKTMRLPAYLESIGRFAFRNCASLEELYISNVSYIDKGAFYSCNSLDLTIAKEIDIHKWHSEWDMGMINSYQLV